MLPEHKNPIFVSKRPKISEKSPILTQKPRFCARKAGKWGSRSQKAHKNADFVLGGPHRTARSGSAGLTEQHGAARRSTEQHGAARRGMEQPPETGQDRLGRSATARSTTKRNRYATQHTQRNASATQLHNGEQQKRRQPFGLSPLKIGGYLLSHMVVQYHRRK